MRKSTGAGPPNSLICTVAVPGLFQRELQEQFLAQGIPLRLGVETVEEAQAEMAAISHWNTAAESAAESHPRAAESPTERYDPD
jgi:hypothetical protein